MAFKKVSQPWASGATESTSRKLPPGRSTHHLRQRFLGCRIVVRAEPRGHHLEARIREGELLDVSLAKIDV